MLEKPVRHLLQGEADVLETDLLADDVERRVRKAVMHGPHHPEQDRAVAHAGVEHPQRRRARVNIGELEPDPAGHHPLFAAGVDEQQVFLPVVEEAEVALWIALPGRDRGRRSRNPRRPRRPIDDRGTRGVRGHAVVVHEASDAVERLGRDPSAIAEPRGELAVIDGAAAEGGFRKPAVPTIVGDLLQQLLGVHAKTPRLRVSLRSRARPLRRAYVMRRTGTANQLRQ